MSATRAAQPTRTSGASPVLGIQVDRTTYADATQAIVQAAIAHQPFVAAATSVHGLTMAALDAQFAAVLNSFDLITPDGQPVRWALNALYGAGLRERVYGPTLMRSVCAAAVDLGLGVYFYGSRQAVLDRMVERLSGSLPGLQIAGSHAPPFRPLTPAEDAATIEAIRASNAAIVFVGLGCPLQERWAHAHRAALGRPIVCVGAAFDFHAGTLRQAPAWMQARGLEWLFRVLMEPRRLWRRYATYIPIFVVLVSRQYVALRIDDLMRRGARSQRTADTS
jgi:exopolysaccharide biosynthesis WecB/TagA/CpsF family protein